MPNYEAEAKDIYLRALEVRPDQRGEVIIALGKGRDDVLKRVHQLLEAHERTRFDLPSAAALPLAGLDEALAELPEWIGEYRIVRLIGSGGMGVVFEAEQSNPKRTVALKVIRQAWASKDAIARFEHESEALARLQHRGIAQIFEAGTFKNAAGNQPYFAMELIHGKPINIFADERGLGMRERLSLVVQLCEALHHAHQRGVIHRDLKPGNILVTDEGQTKILDFGVARLTNSDVQATTRCTEIGQIVGTVPYMSPEQLAADPNELDTRSDVYALGVIAYELLAGRLPHDLTKKLIHEAVRVVHDDEPARLGSINAALGGDIETIVAKAMEKDKSRRYQSALDLSSDISRYLRDEPITARPASAWYQLQKFASRNRTLVSAIGLAGLALTVTTGIAVTKAIETSTQTKLAEAETERATGQTKAAEAARAVADRRAIEAEQARAEAQKNLALSYSSAAAVAAQKGSWNQALAAVDLALKNGATDVAGLILLRIDSLSGLDQLDEAYADAVKLEAIAEDDATRARALLWRGELSMGSMVPAAAEKNGTALITQAVKLGLPPAEDAYARALLATTWEETYSNLSKTVSLNPFNVRAQLLLAIIEILGGKLEDAQRRVELARTLAPISAQPMVVSTIVAIAAGDHELFNRSRKGFKLLGHGSMAADLDTLVGIIDDLRAMMRTRSTDPVKLLKLLGSTMSITRKIGTDLNVSTVRSPPGVFWSRQVGTAMQLAYQLPTMLMGARFEKMDWIAKTFDGFGPGFKCVSLYARATQAQMAGQTEIAREYLDDLMAAPSTLLDLRPIARELRLRSLAISYAAAADAKVTTEFHAELRSAAFDASPWTADFILVLSGYAVKIGDDELAHAFLSRCEKDHGQSPDLKLAKARVAFQTGDYANAARLARELLAEETGKKGPAAETMRKEEQEIVTEASARVGMVGRGREARPAAAVGGEEAK